jgi:putative toxin-antitoxin system antitoxin component (TIGR02293 family)
VLGVVYNGGMNSQLLTPIPNDVFDLAVQVLGSESEALAWFNQANRALGEEKPATVAQTEEGAQEVKHLLGRIEHGVFS